MSNDEPGKLGYRRTLSKNAFGLLPFNNYFAWSIKKIDPDQQFGILWKYLLTFWHFFQLQTREILWQRDCCLSLAELSGM